jgi:alcohol dehydrogenase YqhD (iron-dependent ADH family)
MDRFLEGGRRTVMNYAPVCLREPENYDARAEIMLTGCLATTVCCRQDALATGFPRD